MSNQAGLVLTQDELLFLKPRCWIRLLSTELSQTILCGSHRTEHRMDCVNGWDGAEAVELN